MRERRTEAVLFDLDGTLADTAPDLGAAANLLRAELGLAPVPLERLRPHTSHGVRGMLGAALAVTPEDPRYLEYSERFLQHYESRLCVDTRLFDDMHALLDALDTASIPWGVVTNKRRRFTEPLMAALQLDRRACCIVSGDSAPHPKPAPDPLLLACEMAALRPQTCLYVGDDIRDIQAGRAAGMRTVAAAYGYLGNEAPIESWNADEVILSPLELLPLAGVTAW